MLRKVRHAAHTLFQGAAYTVATNPNHRLNDIVAETAELLAAHPQLPELAAPIIVKYRPNSAKMTGAWAATRFFTVETAAAMLPHSFDVARRLMTMSAPFHMWVWSRSGTELTIRRVYTQSNIDRFLETVHRHRSEGHRWGVSRQLVKIGRELADADLIAIPAPNGKVRSPFTTKQIASMHSWANSLTTVKKRQNAQALLGLAGGAGLTAAEIVNVRVADVHREGDVVFVNITGKRARRVPVRHAWARVLLRSVKGRIDAGERVFRGPWIAEYPPRIIQSFLTDHPAPVRPTPAALRAAWLLHHINNNVPLPVLRDVAGFDHYTTLVRYYEHANALDVGDFTAQLVGAEVAR